MFQDLEAVDWQDCGREYTRVENQISVLTQDVAQRSEIYRILWRYGGRCDCTTAFNIVKQPEVRASVEQEIERVLSRV